MSAIAPTLSLTFCILEIQQVFCYCCCFFFLFLFFKIAVQELALLKLFGLKLRNPTWVSQVLVLRMCATTTKFALFLTVFYHIAMLAWNFCFWDRVLLCSYGWPRRWTRLGSNSEICLLLPNYTPLFSFLGIRSESSLQIPCGFDPQKGSDLLFTLDWYWTNDPLTITTTIKVLGLWVHTRLETWLPITKWCSIVKVMLPTFEF